MYVYIWRMTNKSKCIISPNWVDQYQVVVERTMTSLAHNVKHIKVPPLYIRCKSEIDKYTSYTERDGI